MKNIVALTIAFCSIIFVTAFAANITPSINNIVLSSSQTSFSFDITLVENNSFAGAEFGVSTSDTGLILKKVDYLDVKNDKILPLTIKDNVSYFGFLDSNDKFSGSIKVATLTFAYTGDNNQTINLSNSKIVRFNGLSVSTSDASSTPFTVKVSRTSSNGVSSSNTNSSNLSGLSVNSSILKFTDISNYSWAEKEIKTLAEKGVIKGISEIEFAPAENIKRADFIVLLVRILGVNSNVIENFSDITADKYYYNEIGIAKTLGLTTGVGDNKFDPEASITRQDMFVLAHRIIKMKSINLEASDERIIKDFTDVTQISDYAKEALSSLVKNGLVKGSDNQLNPLHNATRAETAVFIYRLSEIIKK